MKSCQLVVSAFIALFIFGSASAESLVISGIYQGKDLYVKNPFSDDGVGFCIYEVLVNGNLTRDEVNSSAFAIDFDILGIKVGAPIEVVIRHKDNCEPLLLNPESIKPKSTFEAKKIAVNGNVLTWSASNESGSLPYIVEQFRWNKWVRAAEIPGIGTPGTHDYTFKLTPYSGENKVRVKQIDHTLKPRYSDAVTYAPSVSVVTFEPKKADKEIVFSSETRYEIYDKFGNLIKTGYGKTVDVSALKSGDDYYVNYDSSFGETFRKK